MGGKALFTIGRVTGIHGLKGYLKIQSFAESISAFKPGMELNVRSPGDKIGNWYEILHSSPYKKGIRLLLKNVDINNAETFIGKELLAARENFYDYRPDNTAGSESDCGADTESIAAGYNLEKDTYFWEDLIGLSVTDLKNGYLGIIDSIFATGSNDVFVVKGGEREVLVPGIKSVVLSVDIDKNEMKIDLPEGL